MGYNLLRNILRILPDKEYIKLMYWKGFHCFPNIESPITFNEKLQWLKLYNRKNEYCDMVDKIAAKDYVASKIGSTYIIPTLAIWNNAKEIDFANLPDTFVMKCNHDSGSIIIVENKNDIQIDYIKKYYKKHLKLNCYWYGREWPYKSISPRVFAEKKLTDSGKIPNDYKFFCFNGIVQYFKIDFDRYTKHGANYYDREKKLVSLGEVVCPPDLRKKIFLPNEIDKMIELAEELSHGIPFLRVDFYCFDGKIFFGEMTFFPASGFCPFTDKEWDYKLGNLLHLPINTRR